MFTFVPAVTSNGSTVTVCPFLENLSELIVFTFLKLPYSNTTVRLLTSTSSVVFSALVGVGNAKAILI